MPNGNAIWSLNFGESYRDEKGNEVHHSPETLAKFFESICDRWCFQLEEGKENKYLHYQCNIGLKGRKDRGPCFKMLLEGIPNLHTKALSPTSKKGRVGDAWFYAMKPDTRVKGPWSSKNYFDETKSVTEIKELLPYQKEILENGAHLRHPREIGIIIDVTGGIGKTEFTKYAYERRLCHVLFKMGNAKDMVQAARSIVSTEEDRGLWLIDVPRASDWKPKAQAEFWESIEKVKDGILQDQRYSTQTSVFKRPSVWIFTNEFPNETCMSRGRFRLWMIDWGNNLCDWDEAAAIKIFSMKKHLYEQKVEESKRQRRPAMVPDLPNDVKLVSFRPVPPDGKRKSSKPVDGQVEIDLTKKKSKTEIKKFSEAEKAFSPVKEKKRKLVTESVTAEANPGAPPNRTDLHGHLGGVERSETRGGVGTQEFVTAEAHLGARRVSVNQTEGSDSVRAAPPEDARCQPSSDQRRPSSCAFCTSRCSFCVFREDEGKSSGSRFQVSVSEPEREPHRTSEIKV